MNGGGFVTDTRKVNLGCFGTEEWRRVPAMLQERAFFSADVASIEALLSQAGQVTPTSPVSPTCGEPATPRPPAN